MTAGTAPMTPIHRMTGVTTGHAARPRRHLGRAAALLVVAATFVGALGGGATVSAQDRHARSSSPELAEAARSALDALGAWEASGLVAHYDSYMVLRDQAAGVAAAELGLDADEMRWAWQRTHPLKQVALLGALTQLGVPYRTRASSEGEGFDCSGLMLYAWRRVGVELPRSSGDQIRAGVPRDRADAEAGDFVHYPGHIMMYLGVGDAIVHSPNSGNDVEIRFMLPERADAVTFADPLTF